MSAYARLLVAGVLVCNAVTATANTDLTIDFNNQPATGWFRGNLLTDGFVFDPGVIGTVPDPTVAWPGEYGIAGPDPQWFANNGTKFLVFDYFLDNTTMNIYSQQNQEFGLEGVDIGVAFMGAVAGQGRTDCSPSIAHYNMVFDGLLSDGSTVSFSQALRMQCDGAGPLDDFETFTFGDAWQHLTRLTIRQTDMYDTPESNVALDNLRLSVASVASPAPEPESYAMFLLGSGLIYGASRRKAKRLQSA